MKEEKLCLKCQCEDCRYNRELYKKVSDLKKEGDEIIKIMYGENGNNK